MINLLEKRKNNPEDEFSSYTSSALDEGASEETYIEKENKEEQEEIKPAAPEEYEEEMKAPAPGRAEIQSAPVYPEYPISPSMGRLRKDETEALVEQIIEEKWDSLTANFGDINLWKERVRTEIISIKQELLRLEHRFEEVNKAVLGKVTEYDKSIKNVGTDVKALEKVLQKILQPLTTNIQELQRITQKLKK